MIVEIENRLEDDAALRREGDPLLTAQLLEALEALFLGLRIHAAASLLKGDVYWMQHYSKQESVPRYNLNIS